MGKLISLAEFQALQLPAKLKSYVYDIIPDATEYREAVEFGL